MSSRVDQRGASARGDVVARDKTVHHHHYADSKAGVVEQLLAKLQAEIADKQQVQDTVEALAYFQVRRSHDGIDGLQAKLAAGKREREYFDAIEKKEHFAKLLARWSLYASAQELFAFLLARIEYEFTHFILPRIDSLDQVEIDQLVTERVITPTINECGSTVFTLNHSLAMGMVYWLAEQCFVRWHQ